MLDVLNYLCFIVQTNRSELNSVTKTVQCENFEAGISTANARPYYFCYPADIWDLVILSARGHYVQEFWLESL